MMNDITEYIGQSSLIDAVHRTDSNEANDLFESHLTHETNDNLEGDSNVKIFVQEETTLNKFTNEFLSVSKMIQIKREQEIAAKDAEEYRKIEELRQQAKVELERWYSERQYQLEQKQQMMKSTENKLEQSTKKACDWSKVIGLLEFTDGKPLSKSKRDLTRMQTSMFNAKRFNDKKNIKQ